MKRCNWARNELAIRYHDEEWGVALHDDRKLFEFLILENAQAGLSWDTILRKRESYRQAFDDFDAAKIAVYDERKLNELIQNSGLVRNRSKIVAAARNARAFLETIEEFDSFNNFIWQFVDGKQIVNCWETWSDVPAKTVESTVMSKELKKRGFSFVGPIICYAFMQATGMVNDHLIDCFRHNQV